MIAAASQRQMHRIHNNTFYMQLKIQAGRKLAFVLSDMMCVFARDFLIAPRLFRLLDIFRCCDPMWKAFSHYKTVTCKNSSEHSIPVAASSDHFLLLVTNISMQNDPAIRLTLNFVGCCTVAANLCSVQLDWAFSLICSHFIFGCCNFSSNTIMISLFDLRDLPPKTIPAIYQMECVSFAFYCVFMAFHSRFCPLSALAFLLLSFLVGIRLSCESKTSVKLIFLQSFKPHAHHTKLLNAVHKRRTTLIRQAELSQTHVNPSYFLSFCTPSLPMDFISLVSSLQMHAVKFA